MFEKLGDLARICANAMQGFIARFSTRFALKYTKILVARRESQLDFGLLGRSLSCNPFAPRSFSVPFSANLTRIPTIKREKDLRTLNKNPKNSAIIVDTSLQNDIALVANARHYTTFLIIHKDIFISKYQILESLCYGADCIILTSEILENESLEMLQNYAWRVGLSVAILDKNGDIAIKKP